MKFTEFKVARIACRETDSQVLEPVCGLMRAFGWRSSGWLAGGFWRRLVRRIFMGKRIAERRMRNESWAMMKQETDSGKGNTRNHGPQLLEALMLEHCVGNHDLVAASEEPLTHKAVQRAKKGRQLTPHMQRRIAAAMNKAVALQGKTLEREWQASDLFGY